MPESSTPQTKSSTPSAGEAIKKTQTGHLPVGSVEQILSAAPQDIKTETLDVPEWGFSVVVRSFTADESARIKQRGFAFREGEQIVAWAEMERMQFLLGVKEPSFTEEQVLELHIKSGPGFARVIKWLDENSGMDKEALKKSREQFLRSQDEAEVRPSPSV